MGAEIVGVGRRSVRSLKQLIGTDKIVDTVNTNTANLGTQVLNVNADLAAIHNSFESLKTVIGVNASLLKELVTLKVVVDKKPYLIYRLI